MGPSASVVVAYRARRIDTFENGRAYIGQEVHPRLAFVGMIFYISLLMLL